MVSTDSAKRTAVASTVLGIKNPDGGRSDEHTLRTTAPEIPAVKRLTSVAIVGSLNQYDTYSYPSKFINSYLRQNIVI